MYEKIIKRMEEIKKLRSEILRVDIFMDTEELAIKKLRLAVKKFEQLVNNFKEAEIEDNIPDILVTLFSIRAFTRAINEFFGIESDDNIDHRLKTCETIINLSRENKWRKLKTIIV